MIAIGVPEVFAGNELFARNFAHRRQQARIAYAARAQLFLDHAGSLLSEGVPPR